MDYFYDTYAIIKSDFDRVVADLKWDTMHYGYEVEPSFIFHRFVTNTKSSELIVIWIDG